jgi:protein TonB
MSVPKWKIYLPTVLGITVIVAVTTGLIWLIYDSMSTEPVKFKKQIQTVNLLKPPPPPPPPKVERPPEPEIKEEVKINEPEQLEELPDMAEQPPMGDLLGLDAAGGAGGDAFGLIGRKGGRGLLDGDPFVLFASQLQKMIEEVLLDKDEIRTKAYSVVLQLWVGQDGSISRAKLTTSTGDEIIDSKLVEMVTGMTMLAQSPPDNLPQPIKLRISSRL